MTKYCWQVIALLFPDSSASPPLLVRVARFFHTLNSGSLDIIQAILAEGADTKAGDRSGVTPLHWATRRAKTGDVIDILASAFARVNYFGSYSEYHADEEPWLFHPGAEFTVDVEASYKPISGLELSLGAENVLNNFPDENPFARVPTGTGSKYPESAPMGLAGGFYYARARYSF